MQCYHSYLLRFWRVDTDHKPAWRASLEDPHTHQLSYFASLPDLFDYLLKQTDAAQAQLKIIDSPEDLSHDS